MSNFAPLEANRIPTKTQIISRLTSIENRSLNTKTGKEDVIESVFASDFLSSSSIYLEGSVPKTLARKLIKREQIPKKEKREFYDNCRNSRAFIG